MAGKDIGDLVPRSGDYKGELACTLDLRQAGQVAISFRQGDENTFVKGHISLTDGSVGGQLESDKISLNTNPGARSFLWDTSTQTEGARVKPLEAQSLAEGILKAKGNECIERLKRVSPEIKF